MDGDTVLETQDVEYGKDAVLPKDPTLPEKIKETEKEEQFVQQEEHLSENKKFPWKIWIPVVAGAAATGVWLFLWFHRKRRIYGTILDTDGTPVKKARITLDGRDTLETVTDGGGYYEFSNLKRGTYNLNRIGISLLETDLSC